MINFIAYEIKNVSFLLPDYLSFSLNDDSYVNNGPPDGGGLIYLFSFSVIGKNEADAIIAILSRKKNDLIRRDAATLIVRQGTNFAKNRLDLVTNHRIYSNKSERYGLETLIELGNFYIHAKILSNHTNRKLDIFLNLSNEILDSFSIRGERDQERGHS